MNVIAQKKEKYSIKISVIMSEKNYLTFALKAIRKSYPSQVESLGMQRGKYYYF